MTTINADGTILLKSHNSAYKPYSVSVDDVLEIWRFYAYTSKEFPESQPEMATMLMAIRNLEEKIGQIRKRNPETNASEGRLTISAKNRNAYRN